MLGDGHEREHGGSSSESNRSPAAPRIHSIRWSWIPSSALPASDMIFTASNSPARWLDVIPMMSASSPRAPACGDRRRRSAVEGGAAGTSGQRRRGRRSCSARRGTSTARRSTTPSGRSRSRSGAAHATSSRRIDRDAPEVVVGPQPPRAHAHLQPTVAHEIERREPWRGRQDAGSHCRTRWSPLDRRRGASHHRHRHERRQIIGTEVVGHGDGREAASLGLTAAVDQLGPRCRPS